MSLNALLTGAFVLLVGVTALVITLNAYLGGGLWDIVTTYKPPTRQIYFGGVVVFLVSWLVAKMYF